MRGKKITRQNRQEKNTLSWRSDAHDRQEELTATWMKVNQPALLMMMWHHALFPGICCWHWKVLCTLFTRVLFHKSVCLRGCLLHPPSPVKTLQAVFKIPCSSLWSYKRCISTSFAYTVVPLPSKLVSGFPLSREYKEDRTHWQSRENVWFGSREGQKRSHTTFAFKGETQMELKEICKILFHFAMTRMTALLQGLQGGGPDKRLLQYDSC